MVELNNLMNKFPGCGNGKQRYTQWPILVLRLPAPCFKIYETQH
jgi:hypothetical protein